MRMNKMTNKSNICCHCRDEIRYNGSKMVQHVRNQYGIYHKECWPVHKAEKGIGRR
jgi:hypothetical protein